MAALAGGVPAPGDAGSFGLAHENLGPCFCPQHGADVLCIFCPSSASSVLLHLLSFFSSSRVGDGEHAPEHPPSDRSHPSWAWGTPRPSLPVQTVVLSHTGSGRGHPSPTRPSGGPSAGKRLTGRRQARRWLPAPDPALGWGAAGSCMLSARIAL